MIHLTSEDVLHLYLQFCPPKAYSCALVACSTCPTQNVCNALLDALVLSNSDGTVANAIYDACVRYREYTDTVCDTYSCPNCDHYIYCTVLRGIAIEGVKLDED